ncbi:hypothetical protein BGX38DRAFT_1199550 [Terfezia claveryi]|nr:hypothetical protein BGX38DRAFT_1199550 [Terfezia claveryi]
MTRNVHVLLGIFIYMITFPLLALTELLRNNPAHNHYLKYIRDPQTLVPVMLQITNGGGSSVHVWFWLMQFSSTWPCT